MRLPSVSVIIPNYNHAYFLEKAISQHLNQSIIPLEIIVVDDGSTDNSKEIIQDFAKKSSLITPLFLKKNQGVVQALNKGLSLAKGDYIFFSAADDLVSPSFLEESLSILLQHPKAAFSFSDPAEYILKKKTFLSFPLFLSNHPCYFSPKQLLSLLKKRYFTFPSNSCLFKRKYFLKIGGFEESLGTGSDWFSCLLLALQQGVCYVPKDLTWFCVRDDSYSSLGLKDSLHQKQTLYKVLDVLKRKYPSFYPLFKDAGASYEQSWRALYWLAKNKKTRDFLTVSFIRRLLIRGIWRYLRLLLPYRSKIFIRKFLSKRIKES